MIAGLVADHRADHLHRRDAVHEVRGDERPGAHPDVHVEVIELQPFDRLLDGPQRADFVDRALGATSSQGEADLPPTPGQTVAAGAGFFE